MRQQVFGTQPKTTDYAGEFIYENNGLVFINHEEGRIIPTAETGLPYEYQYHLKDHLGNVRVTFSEEKQVNEYIADMESETNVSFLNYHRTSFDAVNRNTTAGGGYYQLLTGGYNSQIGLAKSFTVDAGDVYDIEVNAKYTAPGTTATNLNALFNAIASAFSLGSTTTGLESDAAYNAMDNIFAGGGPWVDDDGNGTPAVYLNYLLFDENFVLVDLGFDHVSTDAASAHELLSLHVKAEKKGYLYIYVSNEQTVQTDVFFDDMKIVQHKGVVGMDDYYPFGLTYNSYLRENSVDNKYKFQGQEHIGDLDLGWDSFKWRNYMPDIGRFFNIDPLADKYVYNSPFAFSENHVTTHVELEGLEKMHFQAALNEGDKNVAQVNFTVDMKESKVNVTRSTATNPFFLESKNLLEHDQMAVVDFEPEMTQNEDGSFDVHGDLSFFGATDLNLNIKIVDGEVVIQTNVDDIGSNMGVSVMVADETVKEANHLEQVNVGEEKPVKQFSDRELNQTTTIPLQGNPSEKIVFDQEKMQKEKEKTPQN